GGRERRLLLDRLAFEGGPGRRQQEDDGRPAHAGMEGHPLRSQAHDLRRLHAPARRRREGLMAGFFWYELMTTDVEGAKAFYAEVVGWTPRAFEGGQDYTVLGAGQ